MSSFQLNQIVALIDFNLNLAIFQLSLDLLIFFIFQGTLSINIEARVFLKLFLLGDADA